MIIHDPDRRTERDDLQLPPYSGMALVQTHYTDFPDLIGIGTAFLATGARLVTAGHVLWSNLDRVREPFLANWIEIFVGDGLYEGFADLVFRISDPSRACRIHPGFIARDGRSDIATIDLPRAAATPLHLLEFPAGLAVGDPVTLSGYPVDHDPISMLEASGPLVSAATPLFQHQVDCWEGQSGAPVRIIRKGAWQVIGVHLGDAEARADGLLCNEALALTSQIIKWILET